MDLEKFLQGFVSDVSINELGCWGKGSRKFIKDSVQVLLKHQCYRNLVEYKSTSFPKKVGKLDYT